jgi:hypothetical protein
MRLPARAVRGPRVGQAPSLAGRRPSSNGLPREFREKDAVEPQSDAPSVGGGNASNKPESHAAAGRYPFCRNVDFSILVGSKPFAGLQ